VNEETLAHWGLLRQKEIIEVELLLNVSLPLPVAFAAEARLAKE
jgi:hypothetical protein